jgi:hypothetical protein
LDEEERDIKKSAFKGGEYKDGDMKKVEMLSEKGLRFQMTSTFGFGNTFDEDRVTSNQGNSSNGAWFLVPIDLPADRIVHEVHSLEKEIQAKREMNVLQCFFAKEFLPDSPGEPSDNGLSGEQVKTKLIPLEDISMNAGSGKSEPLSHNEDNNFSGYNDQNNFAHVIQNSVHQHHQHAPATEENFYNPSKPLAAAATLENTTSTSASATSSGAGLSLNIDSDYLKQILQTVMKTNEPAVPVIAPVVEEKKKKTLLSLDIDMIKAAEADATQAALSSPISPPKYEYKRSGSRWSDETITSKNAATPTETSATNGGWSSSNKYTSNNGGYNKPNGYFNSNESGTNASSGDRSGYNSGRNVFTNNFKRGIGNRPGSTSSSSGGSFNDKFRGGYNNGYDNNRYNSNESNRSGGSYQSSRNNSSYNSYNGDRHNSNDRYGKSSTYNNSGSSRRGEDEKTSDRGSTTRIETPAAVPIAAASVSNTNISSGKWL